MCADLPQGCPRAIPLTKKLEVHGHLHNIWAHLLMTKFTSQTWKVEFQLKSKSINEMMSPGLSRLGLGDYKFMKLALPSRLPTRKKKFVS